MERHRGGHGGFPQQPRREFGQAGASSLGEPGPAGEGTPFFSRWQQQQQREEGRGGENKGEEEEEGKAVRHPSGCPATASAPLAEPPRRSPLPHLTDRPSALAGSSHRGGVPLAVEAPSGWLSLSLAPLDSAAQRGEPQAAAAARESPPAGRSPVSIHWGGLRGGAAAGAIEALARERWAPTVGAPATALAAAGAAAAAAGAGAAPLLSPHAKLLRAAAAPTLAAAGAGSRAPELAFSRLGATTVAAVPSQAQDCQRRDSSTSASGLPVLGSSSAGLPVAAAAAPCAAPGLAGCACGSPQESRSVVLRDPGSPGTACAAAHGESALATPSRQPSVPWALRNPLAACPDTGHSFGTLQVLLPGRDNPPTQAQLPSATTVLLVAGAGRMPTAGAPADAAAAGPPFSQVPGRVAVEVPIPPPSHLPWGAWQGASASLAGAILLPSQAGPAALRDQAALSGQGGTALGFLAALDAEGRAFSPLQQHQAAVLESGATGDGRLEERGASSGGGGGPWWAAGREGHTVAEGAGDTPEAAAALPADRHLQHLPLQRQQLPQLLLPLPLHSLLQQEALPTGLPGQAWGTLSAGLPQADAAEREGSAQSPGASRGQGAQGGSSAAVGAAGGSSSREGGDVAVAGGLGTAADRGSMGRKRAAQAAGMHEGQDRSSAAAAQKERDGSAGASGGWVPSPLSPRRKVGAWVGKPTDGEANRQMVARQGTPRGKRLCKGCSAIIAAAAADCAHCGFIFRPSKWNQQWAGGQRPGSSPSTPSSSTQPASGSAGGKPPQGAS